MTFFMVGLSVVLTAEADDDDLGQFIRRLSKELVGSGSVAHVGGSVADGKFTILVEVDAEDSFLAEMQASAAVRDAARVAGAGTMEWPDPGDWPAGLRTDGIDVAALACASAM